MAVTFKVVSILLQLGRAVLVQIIQKFFAKLNVIVNEIRFICIKHPKLGDVIAIAKALWVLFPEDSYKYYVVHI